MSVRFLGVWSYIYIINRSVIMTQDNNLSVSVYVALSDALSAVVRNARSDQTSLTDVLERDGERNTIHSLLRYIKIVCGSSSRGQEELQQFVRCLEDLLNSKDKDLLYGSLGDEQLTTRRETRRCIR